MTNYVLAYRGGAGMAATPEAQEQSMAEWGAWFATIGADLVEIGSPFGASLTVNPDGSTGEGSSTLSGYSVVSSTSLAAAADLAKGCPLLRDGGTVEVYETIAM